MEVIRAEMAGFCMGVSLAVGKLDAMLETKNSKNPGARLYTLGPIIHNPKFVRDYAEKGVFCLTEPYKLEPGDTVVIRAHGVPCAVEESLRSLGVNIIDATCPKVKAAQLGIHRAASRTAGTLLLYGEYEHPEVKGLLSYAGADALVFSSLEALKGIRLDKGREYFLAAQTTQEKNIFDAAVAYINSELGRETEVLNTICGATRERQDEVIELCSRVRSMVIVGGMNSGNTRRLAEIAQKMVTFALHCEDGRNLPLDKLCALQPVGLSAGASTPASHIDEVEGILRMA